MRVNIPVSPGELYDKITILEIKEKKIKSHAALKHVKAELSYLRYKEEKVKNKLPVSVLPELDKLKGDLFDINLLLWEVEDVLREMEASRVWEESPERFIAQARRVYFYNDTRSDYKNKINTLTMAEFTEIKQYPKY